MVYNCLLLDHGLSWLTKLGLFIVILVIHCSRPWLPSRTWLDHGWSLWTMVYLLWSWSTMVNHGSRPWLPSRTWFDYVEPMIDHGWPWMNMVNHGHISQGKCPLTLIVLETSLYTFANSVDPDQRAPWGALWSEVYYVCYIWW